MDKRPMKILFVDDSPEILTSLERMMKKSPWKVAFAEGGMAALDMLEESHFDVVVTDLNMPEVSGIKLLKIIEKEFPHLIRIIYSGNLSKESVREVAAYTHRFIAKPCSMEKMILTIENTSFIYNTLDNDAIRKVLTNTGSLPSLPRIYTELMANIENPEFSLKDAAHLIGSDVGMTVNILKQINLLGHAKDITSIDQAVSLLGLDSINAITLSTHIFNSAVISNIANFSSEQLTLHSMLTARFAQEITLIETDNRKLAESAYVAGVLHDLGIILLASNFPTKYEAVLERVFNAARPIADVEHNLIGISHSEIGAYLLALWGFPKEILSAVAFHENPMNQPAESFSLLTAVYAGSYLAHQFEKDHPNNVESLENSKYLEQIGSNCRIKFWESRCEEIHKSISKKA